MKFELSYSILYRDLFKSDLAKEQQSIVEEIAALDLNSARLLSARLKDPDLVKRMYQGLKLLGIDSCLDFEQASRLLVLELKHRQSLTNCFVWQQQIRYSQNAGLCQRALSPEEQTTAYFTAQVLAHGLRWGWTVVELMGRSAIVKAETEVVVNYQGCSCGISACAHAAFAAAVRAEWTKIPYCIKLVDPTLT